MSVSINTGELDTLCVCDSKKSDTWETDVHACMYTRAHLRARDGCMAPAVDGGNHQQISCLNSPAEICRWRCFNCPIVAMATLTSVPILTRNAVALVSL